MGKALKELNVKPGDVVRHEDGERHPIKNINGRLCAASYESEWSLHVESSTMPVWSIVSRATPEIDLTAITTPLGLLDDATRDALKAHGGPYERYHESGWHPVSCTGYLDATYRVKPSPKVEAVELYGSEELHWIFSGSPVDCDTHKLTLKIQSGEIIGVIAEKLI